MTNPRYTEAADSANLSKKNIISTSHLIKDGRASQFIFLSSIDRIICKKYIENSIYRLLAYW